jgi:hypothetical protein
VIEPRSKNKKYKNVEKKERAHGINFCFSRSSSFGSQSRGLRSLDDPQLLAGAAEHAANTQEQRP